MGFVYRVVRVLKGIILLQSLLGSRFAYSLALKLCAQPSIFYQVRKSHVENYFIVPHTRHFAFSGCPRKFYHRFMYIAPSSGHELMNLDLHFKLILRRFEVVF